MDAIRSMLSPHATVVRDGERTTVPAGEVVPGDVVFLQSGDRVPADIRLLGVNSLQCEEAALTGGRCRWTRPWHRWLLTPA